ncbi:MAG: sensor histidine kinase [Thermodesulfobacteriota bacterium]
MSMNVFSRWLARFLPEDQYGIDDVSGINKRYKKFRTNLLTTMLTISLLPAIITAAIGYFQYRDLLQTTEREQLLWNLEGAQKTMQALINELHSSIEFIVREDRCDEILDQDTLDGMLIRLKLKYSGFVDLGVIDSRGIQLTYSGPYKLKGYNYRVQEWFEQVRGRGFYISNVFLGYRNIPHFVIAVSKKRPDSEDHWVLRATINADTLQEFISTINTKASDDIFLVSRTGKLQTSSRYFGNAMEYCPICETSSHLHEIFKLERGMGDVLQVSAPLENTPWMLVLVKEKYIHQAAWFSFRKRLLLIFLGCSAACLVISYSLANMLTNRIRETDEKRQSLLTEAEHSNKLASIGRLAAGVAHEINNPLAIIDQKSGLMQDLLGLTEEFKYKEKFYTSIAGIQNSVGRCKAITHRLLGFARRMDVILEEIKLNELIQEVLNFLEKEAMYNRIRMELHFQADLPAIYCDRGQLQQIFLNIINNAIDAIGKDGLIAISTRLQGNDVLVRIKDSGPGIPPNILQHIFDPFFTTKAPGKGTGLGLSITYGLVKKLGGEITVSSEVGKGATFEIRLPVKPDKSAERDNNERNQSINR